MGSKISLKVLGGACIVAGTAIGAGMLALPVVTAVGGLIPSSMIYLICYLFSIATGLLLVEICYWMPQNANLVSMTYHLLGPVGRIFAWILYIFLFYSLTVAYVSGGGAFVTLLFQGSIPLWLGDIIFALVFGAIVYLGTTVVDRINFLLVIGLFISFFVFFIMGVGQIKLETLMHSSNMLSAMMALPVMFTSFSYQGVIPSLYAYLDRDSKKVRQAILIGAFLPLILYLIWEVLILGIVPLEGLYGLLHAKKEGWTAVQPLKFFLKTPWVVTVGEFFAFCALTTSFLGVTLGLVDFLADSLQIKKEGIKKLFLCLLVYVPSTVIACTYPNIFLVALGYAGGVGCVLLLGLLPICMVWVGRYRKHYTRQAAELGGGKLMLGVLFLFIVIELVIEIVQEVQRLGGFF